MRYSSLWTVVFLCALAGCGGGGAPLSATPPLATESARAENIVPLSFPVKITQIIPFDVLPGCTASDPFALNQHDIAVGRDDCPGLPLDTAVMMTPSSLTKLGGLPTYSGSEANGINIRNVSVGVSCFEKNGVLEDICIATRWSSGSINDLGVLPGMTESVAKAINDSDVIVGYSGAGSSNSDKAVEWTGGTIKALGQGIATSINNHGVIVGFTLINGHAEQYGPGTPKPIQPLLFSSEADAVNNLNVVVGSFTILTKFNGFYETHPFTTLNGQAHFIPLPAGGHFTTNTAINDLGDVVGTYSKTGFDSSAFISIGGKTVDLNTLLPPLSSWKIEGVSAIDNNRVVVGGGTFFGKSASFFLRLK